VVVGLDWEPPEGEDWDPEIPVVRAELPDVPLRAWEVAREVAAMEALEAAGEGDRREVKS
jgi:hypothetical protein